MFKSISLILLLSSLVIASDNLKFSFDGDFGIVPNARSQTYLYPNNYKYFAYKNVFFLTLSPKIEWKFIYGDIDITTFSSKVKTNNTFTPTRVVWKNEFGLFHDFKNVRLSIYWDHLCGHKVTPSVSGNENFDLFDNVYDKVALRFSYHN